MSIVFDTVCDSIYANSEMEAKYNFIIQKYEGIECGDYEIFKIENILVKYYKLDSKYINDVLNKFHTMNILTEWPFNKNKKITEIQYCNIDTTIPNFMSVFKKLNINFIIKMINNGCIDIKVYETQTRITQFSLNRIKKKIKNNNYWNIWRMF